MSWIESIFYGLISGITDFLPVSSRAHQALFRYLFGVSVKAPLQELLIHIGVFFSIILGCWEVLLRLRREQKALSGPRRRRVRSFDSRSLYDLRLLKTASVPLLAGSLLYFTTARLENNLLSLMVFLFLNGFVLLLTDHTRRGNRDSRTMSGLDGIVMGILGALSVFPGVSRTGMICAYGTARGAQGQNAATWAVLLGIPAMLFSVVYDMICVVSSGTGAASFTAVICCILSGFSAFCGGYIGITLLKTIVNHSGFSKFAYYAIGAGLFSFILYLIT